MLSPNKKWRNSTVVAVNRTGRVKDDAIKVGTPWQRLSALLLATLPWRQSSWLCTLNGVGGRLKAVCCVQVHYEGVCA